MIERELKSKIRIAGSVLVAALSLQGPFGCATATPAARPTAAVAPVYPTPVTVLVPRPHQNLRIRDTVRMKNEVPNELIGMGLVVGLQGTGDGGSFLPTQRAVTQLMKNFDFPVSTEQLLKYADDAAYVMLSMSIPPAGAHAGERLDVKVSALGAKSLKGGRLIIVPMYPPRPDLKTVMASASGELMLPDEKHLTEGVVVGGGVLVEDILPEEIEDNTFTLVIHPNMVSYELASAIADQINEDVAPQTGGKAIAIADRSTSVKVTIPQVERANPTPFIARLLTLPLPDLR